MRRSQAFCLGLFLACVAFTPYLPFFGTGAGAGAGPFFPTNIPGGFSASAWYEPGTSGYFTNASVATLTNLAGDSTINLTNSTTATFPVRQVAALNGLDTLYFSGLGSPPRLFAKTWSNTSPFEVFIVLAITNAGSKAVLRNTVDGGGGSSTNTWAFNQSGGTMTLSQGSSSISCGSVTNRWIVVDLVYSNANSFIYTNNVLGKTGAAGTNFYLNGLMIGCDNQPANGIQMSFACLFTFTNQLLTATARSNAYYYCTNRFAIAVP